MNKICSKCKGLKDIEGFQLRSTAGSRRQSWCKVCMSLYRNAWRLKNLNKRRKLAVKEAQRRRSENKIIVDKLKSNPCTDCHKSYSPWIMQYDHIGNNKTDKISYMLRQGRSIKRILEEIAKCELVCANCHADRSHNRAFGSF